MPYVIAGPTGVCSGGVSDQACTADAPGEGTVLTVRVVMPHDGDHPNCNCDAFCRVELISICTSPRHPAIGFVGLSQPMLAQQTMNVTSFGCRALITAFSFVDAPDCQTQSVPDPSPPPWPSRLAITVT